MDAFQSIVTDLNTLIPIVNHWFHLLSAVIWIGGLAFLVMASVTPASRRPSPGSRSSPSRMSSISTTRKVAGILLVILLFTGGINLHYVNQVLTSQTGSGVQHHAKYLTVFFIKLFLVLCLLTLFLYTVIFKSDDEAEEGESYEVIPFQRAALWMGFSSSSVRLR